jgi:hypothetical protein
MATDSHNSDRDDAATYSRYGSSTIGRWFAWTLVAIWAAVAATGMGMLAAYANSAGKMSPAPAFIDGGEDSAAAYRLSMFLHPRCPCSKASVNELARIMARCSEQLDATVYFVRPESQPEDWERGALWNLASSIPGVAVETDIGGRVAEQFHANTSGEVVVYDRQGKLRFHGGITSARGHAGDNVGESAVIDIASGGTTDVERSPVFGCPFRAEVDSNN